MCSSDLLVHLLACATGTGGPVQGDAGVVVSLTVDPAEATVNTGPDGAGTVDFEAIATFDDGTTEPIDLVSWELSNQAAGSIDADGVFTGSTENGAITTVTATHNGISATAVLTATYVETIDEGGGSSADYDGDAAGTVTILYPPDGVSVPRNVPNLSFMWEEVSGAEGYRLSFTTPTTSVTVLTTDNRWTAEAEQWVAIAATNAGGTVDFEVRALVGGQIYASPTQTLTVNRLDAQGSIYYWSTSDQGIVKVPIGAVDSDLFYTPDAGSPTCVACHTIREERMGVSYGTGNGGSMYTGITDVSGAEPVELTDMTERGYYNTLNPDGTLMISTSLDGDLNLWNAVTGELIGPLDTGGLRITQPDWSQDGTMLAAISSLTLFGDNNFDDGVLVVAPIDEDGTLGEFTTLLDPADYFGRDEYQRPNVFYPAISPDGEWIAFNYGNQQSYDNDTASLWVISINGGDPIELVNANQADGLTNSWPHWGPLPDDDVFWLTFSSKRPYGDEITDSRPQIWVAAFNPTLAEAAVDPSSPAFWLSNQDPETSNHSTFWGP